MNAVRESILATVRAAERWRAPGDEGGPGAVAPEAAIEAGAPGAVSSEAGAPPAASPETAPPRTAPPAGAASDREALVAKLCERLSAYKADVRRVPAPAVASELEKVCRERGASRLVVPPGLPGHWRPAGLEIVEDRGLSAKELDAFDGVVTGCTVGVAESGTLVLTGGPAEGRRAVTLVPDLHVCVVGEEQVLADLAAALPALAPLVRRERRPLTFVSGPSATSDIELQRVEGVHGPRQMVVLVVSGNPV